MLSHLKNDSFAAENTRENCYSLRRHFAWRHIALEASVTVKEGEEARLECKETRNQVYPGENRLDICILKVYLEMCVRLRLHENCLTFERQLEKSNTNTKRQIDKNTKRQIDKKYKIDK